MSTPHVSEPCPRRTYYAPDAPHIAWTNHAECRHCGAQLGDRVRTPAEIEADETAAEIEADREWLADRALLREAHEERAGLTSREAAEAEADTD